MSTRNRHIHYITKQHSAVRTDSYVFSQLIPYIGNKRKLLHLIGEAIELTGVNGSGTFVDLFTGSTVVARMAKQRGLAVVANDWEPYSYEIAKGTVELNSLLSCESLGFANPDGVFRYLNDLEPFHGYIATHLCPTDDENPDPECERMFFTRQNGERIDAIRERIWEWEQAGLLDDSSKSYLLAALMYAVSYASNTSGVFKGFHRGWGGATSTALYRIRGELSFKPPILHNNGRRNWAFREDAQDLAGELGDVTGGIPDIVYLDPPYNQHPYGSNYHVLNTVALWDKPELNPTFLQGGRIVDKAAIRKDWRTERRSPYNYRAQAVDAFESLIQEISARWLLVSYSTDGNIPLEDLFRILTAAGTVDVVVEPYKRYRVSTPRMSEKSHNAEFVAVVNLNARDSSDTAADFVEMITRVEDSALARSALNGVQNALFE